MKKIADDAVMPITENSYPKTYTTWRAEGIARINALMQPAAELVAASPGCDKLEILGLSDRSSPPNNIVFYADCSNGNRFYITEDDVINSRKVASQNDKSKWLDDQQLVEISHEAIKGRLKVPCSFLRSDVYRAVVGRTVVTVEFSVAGDAEPNIAKCYFDGLSLKEIECNW